MYQPNVLTSNQINLNTFFTTIERLGFGGNINLLSENKDYFEPRVEGRFVIYSPNIGFNGWISTDYRKKFAFDFGLGYRTYNDDPQNNFSTNFNPRYRFSDHFLLVWGTNYY